MASINVTTGTAGVAGSTAAELINELKRPMLAVSEFDNFLEQYIFEQVRLTNAKTIQWNDMDRMSVGPTVSQLTEGVAPKPESMTINSVTATMEEYGRAVYFSTLAVLTARNPLIEEAIRRLGYNVKETRDRLLYAIANAATNTYRVNDRANDNAIAVGDKISFEELSEVKGILRTNGVPRFPDGAYHLVLHSSQYQDMATDANWLAASQFAYAEEIRQGTPSTVMGVKVYETNSNSFTVTASATSGNSDSIRSSFIAGPGAAKVTDLQATEMHIQAPGQGSDYTKRRYQLAWTATFKGVITKQGFLRRVRASSSDAAAVA